MMLPLKAKKIIQRIMTSNAIGWTIRKFYRENIPSNTLMVYAPDTALSARMIAKIFWGFYEKSEVSFVNKYLRGDLDVLELGSSIGVVAAHAAKKLKHGRRLVCVEANPNLIPLLKRNIALNAPGVQVEFVNGAVDYSGCSQVFLELGASHTDSSVYGTGITQVKVSAFTLSEIIAQYGFGEFALICDIEGSEWEMLLEERQVLKMCRQLIIELHPRVKGGVTISVEQMKDMIIGRLGFNLSRRRGDVFHFERQAK